MTCLERCCAIENVTRRIKDVLRILERLAPCAMSEKFQTLSLLLKEIMRKLICCGQDLEGNFLFNSVLLRIVFLQINRINRAESNEKGETNDTLNYKFP